MSRWQELGQGLTNLHRLVIICCCMFCVKHPKKEETNHLGRHGKHFLVELLL
jgi:hypothetical protein